VGRRQADWFFVHVTRKKPLTFVGLLSLGALWFVAVDRSWFVHDCPDCGYSKDVVQYRLFTVSVHETVFEYPSIVQRVAADLGVHCTHGNSARWHKHRWWGLCICRSPCINGSHRLTFDDSWYDLDASASVAALAHDDPSIKTDFVRRVLEQHEFAFVRTVLSRASVQPDRAEERSTRN
jgi:hypothetical protein